MTPNIIFLKVTTNQEKLLSIVKIIQKHFELNHKVLVVTPTNEVAQYIDLLVWRMPQDSFIPHVVSNIPCSDAIVITTQNENLNKASVLINLLQERSPIYPEFQTVYELYDLTHPSKEESSKTRLAGYSALGLKLTTTSAL